MNDKLLIHSVINEIERDLNSLDYESLDELLNLLIKNDKSKKLLLGYLSDDTLEALKKGTTIKKYS